MYSCSCSLDVSEESSERVLDSFLLIDDAQWYTGVIIREMVTLEAHFTNRLSTTRHLSDSCLAFVQFSLVRIPYFTLGHKSDF